ncbi:MAG: LLM class flavin-dependent oxidoreductase [Nitrospinota bacterium]
MPPSGLKFGIALPAFAWEDPGHTRAPTLRSFAERAEELGFDSVWMIDRPLRGEGLYRVSWLEPLTCLAHVAACTGRVKIGTCVLVLPLRHPVLLAKELATLDSLTEGRFILGAGLGWHDKDYEAIGAHIRERGKRTDEILSALRLLLTRPGVSFEGRHYRFENVTIEPRPKRVPPIWIAGGSRMPDPKSPDKDYIPPRVLERIAESDGVLIRSAGNHEFAKRDLRIIREYVHSAGCRVEDFTFGYLQFVHVVEAPHRQAALALQRPAFECLMGSHRSFDHLQQCYLMGTIDDIIGRIEELSRAGLNYLILSPVTDDLEQLELIAEKIIPCLSG